MGMMEISKKVVKCNHPTDFISRSWSVFPYIKTHMQSHPHRKNNLKFSKHQAWNHEKHDCGFHHTQLGGRALSSDSGVAEKCLSQL